MKTEREALKLALEHIEGNYTVSDKEAITAIKEVLAQPEQERPPNCGTGYCSCIECVMEPKQKPVAWLYLEPDNPHLNVHYDDVDVSQFPHDEWFPVYKSSPQRTWVGLTSVDWNDFNAVKGNDPQYVAQWAEAKLKEKNT